MSERYLATVLLASVIPLAWSCSTSSSSLKGFDLSSFSMISCSLALMASQLTPKELKDVADQLGAEDYISQLFEFTEVDFKIKKASLK